MELSKSRCEKVLGRFNKKELPVVAAQLGLRVDIKTSSTKKAIISTLVERCIHGKVTPKDLLNVELQCKLLRMRVENMIFQLMRT